MIRRRGLSRCALAGLCVVSWLTAAPQERVTSLEAMPDAPSATLSRSYWPAGWVTRTPSLAAKPVPPGDITQAVHPMPDTFEPALSIEMMPEASEAQDKVYTLSKRVNFVVVPVTVKDKATNRMLNGLAAKDFAVYENNRPQKLTYFTSDPFSVSAAIVYDLGMAEMDVQMINRTFSALAGAFSQYDRASIYTFSNTVACVNNFIPAIELTSALDQLRTVRGRDNGVPVLSGPLAWWGPVVNGLPTYTGLYPVRSPVKVSHILNDAILYAALDLAKQDNTRRKVILIISDGHEWGSLASYSETIRVLLSHQISLYAIATGSSAQPGYKQLSQSSLPRFGYDNLLPRYARATGGEVFTESARLAIETAYASAMSNARNQYTLGYQTTAAPSDEYRTIEVTVDVPNVDVYAKAGYYSPPAH